MCANKPHLLHFSPDFYHSTLHSLFHHFSSSVTWRKNNVELRSDAFCAIKTEGEKHTLLIKELRPHNAGSYCVTAANEAGTSSCSAFLHIQPGEKSLLHLNQLSSWAELKKRQKKKGLQMLKGIIGIQSQNQTQLIPPRRDFCPLPSAGVYVLQSEELVIESVYSAQEKAEFCQQIRMCAITLSEPAVPGLSCHIRPVEPDLQGYF